MSIKFVVFDFDGVFTDGKVYFNKLGDIQKYYNVKDGLGINLLQKNNIEVGVISGYKNNDSQLNIISHLNIQYFSFGTNEKLNVLKKWCDELNINLETEVAYMGDDINDLSIMKEVKIVGCPKDAHSECKQISTFVSKKDGGNGCIREFCEYIIENYLKEKNNYDFKQGKITAIVAVRKNSVRCKNKNIKPISDSNLLTMKLKILKNIETIDDIILTTDCEISKLIGKHMNIKIDDRPDFYCSDECDGSTMLNYIASICSTEHILYSPVTSPFFSKQFLKEIILKYKSLDNKYDSIVTKNTIRNFIWNNKNPINYNISTFPRSQDLTNDIFSLNFGCCILPKEVMMTQKYIVGKNPLFIYNNEEYSDIDVDTPLDLMVTEQIYNNKFKIKQNIKFIDVTIRDGGFTNNWNWSYEEVITYYNLCVSLNYKYFEIGYFINENLKETDSGLWRNLPFDILNNFPIKKECKISAMIDHWKYDIQQLKPRTITKIDLIRVTSYKENIIECLEYCKKIKKLGYEVSLNLIVCSWLNNTELLNIIQEILKNDNFLDIICIADSYGNMNPEKTRNIITCVSSYLSCLNIPLGYHIHDTAGLGFSNAITALDMGIEYLDTSLFGIGKGVGNLSCNNILLYLNSKGKLNNNIIIQLLEFIDNKFPEKRKDMENILQGFYNIHPLSFSKKKNHFSIVKTYNNILKLTNSEKYHYSNLNK